MTSPNRLLKEHPTPDEFGCYTVAVDGRTNNDIPHRSLTQGIDNRKLTVEQIRAALIEHHISEGMLAQDRRKIENLRTLGYPITDDIIHRFPTSETTRKGNLAEVFLSEYICAATGSDLPLYRLRYNPNVEQSMKGDDVLAFDFSSKRPRIIVGEAKFRGTPSKKAVQDIVSGLVRSYKAGLPASLQFVADRLYEVDNIDLADRISDCPLQMAKGRLDLSYVGFLLSDTESKSKVDQHTEGSLRSLVMISLGMDSPTQIVIDCFEGIEAEVYDNPE